MAEEYCGVKFRTIFNAKEILNDSEILELINWCNEFNKIGFTPGCNGSAGNLAVKRYNQLRKIKKLV